jgi:putative nucleotidyltransferase with HDIG domain
MTGMPMPSVLLARRRPGLPTIGSWAAIGWVSAILAMSFGTFLAVQLTGGSPNALNNLGYVSITLAGYRFGVKGGAPAGLLYGLLSGPAAFLVGLAATEPPSSWTVRLAVYVGVGLLIGGLTDKLRTSLAVARAARDHVTRTETDSMLALARGAEAKDTDTGEHIRRVQLASESLARSIGRPEPEVLQIGWAAMLHDIGKLHVPDRILRKPGPLDAEEEAIIRRHPVWGAEILGGAGGFALATKIARWHHEDFDGSGYPDGLRGDAIPFEARIVRVADAFDAMTNDRPYRSAMTLEAALEQLDRFAGRQFDPELVRLMIELCRGPALAVELGRINLQSRGRFE